MSTHRQFAPRLRIPALILCVTFSVTQAAPAWAMRAEGVASAVVKTGLEENLLGGRAPTPVVTVGNEADWEAMGMLPGFTPVDRVEVGSSAVPATSWSLSNGPTESRWRWVGGVAAPGAQSTLAMFKNWVRIDWPMVQWALQHPDRATQRWLTAPIADLIEAIKDGQTAAVAAAIRRDCAFCATIGQALSAQPTYQPEEPPISMSQFVPLFDLLAQQGIQNILRAPRPTYLVADDDQDVSLAKSEIQFTVFTGTTRTRPPVVTLDATARQEVQSYLARRAEVRALRPAKPSEDPVGFAAWREAQQQLTSDRRRIFSAIAQTAYRSHAEFRSALFEGYAGGRARIGGYLALSWQLKRFQQFAHLLVTSDQQADFKLFVDRLDQLIAREDAALVEYRDVFAELSPDDREIVLRTLVDLKDLSWNIRNDLLNNIERVGLLGGIPPDQAAAAPTPTIQRLWALTMLLNGIDSRMETRGRDSLGTSIMATFENQAAYEIYLRQLGPRLQEQLRQRQQIVDLGDMSVRIRPGVNAQGAADPSRPVTVTFIYKVAEVVGYLGDNAKAIRQQMISDQIFQALLRQPLMHFTAVAHTRWASAGGISIPNTHPVTNEGNYVFPAGFQNMDYTAIPLDDGSFQMVAQINSALPKYGRNGRVFVVLNGDVDNYNREQLARTGFFPNLTQDYAALSGPWQSRRISIPRTSDTHLIPFRIENYLLLGYDLLSAVQRAAREFDGSFAIQVQSDLEPGKLILALNGKGQGLYVGISPDGFHPASETYGFIDVTQRFYRLKPGQVVLIDQNLPPESENLVVTTLDGKRLPITEINIERTSQTTRDTYKPPQYNRFFVKEVSEAADMFESTVLGRALVQKTGLEESPKKSLVINLSESEFPGWIRARLREGRFRRAIITGMGTAHAAGLVIADALKDYLSRGEVKYPLTIETPLAPELAAYNLSEDMTDTLVIVISQSGKSTDTNDPLGKAIEAGATAIGILNTRDSDAAFLIKANQKNAKIAKLGDTGEGGVLYTGSGRDIELAVASTKAYYAQIAAGVILAIQIARELGIPDSVFFDDVEELHRLPGKMRRFEQSVTQSQGKHPLIEAAKFFPLFKMDWAVVSSGPGLAAAREALIKLSELCYRCIYQDSMVNLKHVNYSAEPWVLMLLANLHGRNEFVQKNGEGELDKMLAQALAATVVVEEGNTRFDGKAQVVFDVTGAQTARPVGVIKVPQTTERFAPIFLTMASHLLAYYAAEAINARGQDLHNRLNAVTAVRAKLLAGGTQEARLLRNGTFHDVVRKEMGPVLQAIRAGYFNVGAKDPRRLVEFALLLPYLTGDLDLSTTSFFLGEPLTAEQVWARFETVTVTLARGAMRTIDSIARQAKYVTVGAKTETERAGDVKRLVDTFRDHPTTKLDRQTLLELAVAYQRYRATGKPVSVAIPDPEKPFERSKVITVADDRVGVRYAVDVALRGKRVTIVSSITDGFYDGNPALEGKDGGRQVAFVVDTIARPVPALQTLAVESAIQDQLVVAIENGTAIGVLQEDLMKRGRRPDQALVFGTLYGRYLQQPGLHLSDQRPEGDPAGRTSLYIAFPYQSDGHAQEINSAVVPKTQQYLATILKPGFQGTTIPITDHFVAIYRGGTPNDQPVAFVSISLNDADLSKLSVDFRGNGPAAVRAVREVLGEYIRATPGAGMEEVTAQTAVSAMQKAYESYAQLYAEIAAVPTQPTPAEIKVIFDLAAAGQFAMARAELLDIFGTTRRIRYGDDDDQRRYIQMMGGLATALEVIGQVVSVPPLGAPANDLLQRGLDEIEAEFGRNPDVGTAATYQLQTMLRRYVETGRPQRWFGEDPDHPNRALYLSIQPDSVHIDATATRVIDARSVNLELTESETILKASGRPLDVLVLRADREASDQLLVADGQALQVLAGELTRGLDEIAAAEASAWAAKQSSASGMQESAQVEQATAVMQRTVETYRRLFATLKYSPFGLPTVEAVAAIRTLVDEHRFGAAHLALLELLGGSFRTITNTGNADGETVTAMAQALRDAVQALAPLTLPPHTNTGLEETATTMAPQPITIRVAPNPTSTATVFAQLQVTMRSGGAARPVVGPEVVTKSNLAVLAGKALNDALGLAAAFQWSSALPVVMVARDEDHQAQIEAGLAAVPEAAQIRVLKIVHVAPGSAWNPDGVDYAVAAQRVADQLKTSGFASYRIQLFLNQSLLELSQFLGLPIAGASRRVFQELEQQTGGTFA